MIDVPKFDRRLNWLVRISTLLLLIVIGFALIAVPRILSTDSTTDAIDRNGEIGGCRASYRSSLVDERMAGLFIAKARLDEATNAGLEATVRNDDEALREIVGRLAGLRDAVDRTALALEEGIAAYHDLVTQSVENPDLFLTGCNGETS